MYPGASPFIYKIYRISVTWNLNFGSVTYISNIVIYKYLYKYLIHLRFTNLKISHFCKERWLNRSFITSSLRDSHDLF